MERTGEFVGNQIMPALTGYAGKMIVGVVKAGVSIFIFFIATIMLFGDRKTIREKYSNFPLHDWAALILRKLKNTGFVYMKAQVIIIFIISVVCTLGIYFVGNKYYLLFGITIAIIDAFPVVGSGSILVPWSIFSLLGGNFINAAILFSVYLITMLIREVLEPKLLGDSLGILPVFMLMAIFVGVKLFGVAGIVLGPIGYVIIGTVMKNCNS